MFYDTHRLGLELYRSEVLRLQILNGVYTSHFFVVAPCGLVTYVYVRSLHRTRNALNCSHLRHLTEQRIRGAVAASRLRFELTISIVKQKGFALFLIT